MFTRRPPSAPGAAVTAAVIALDGVAVGYGERPVVEDVDLVVRRGDVVALVGANGSGKTTLVRGMLGLAPVLAGRVELLGSPAATFRERWRIGYVPQRHTAGGGVPSSVQEVVASGRLARRRLLSPATAADRLAIREALETVGLADRRHAPVATLSGGQQRRTLIARALAADPDVLLMDEPTAGVDAAGQESLVRTLTRLVGQGLTLVVVTHEIEPLVGLLTRVVEMREGRVVRDEPLPGGDPAVDLRAARGTA
jgi:zinc transport system ATP-binding protein